jgi:radical SAM superfamily enzyme with C-terminal helix-hairpin-helix motif
VGAAASARLLAIGATWRLTGVHAAGQALVTAVADDRETERTLAGMLLVQAGERSVPVVTDAILAGRAAAELVNVLASIGSREARASLARVS